MVIGVDMRADRPASWCSDVAADVGGCTPVSVVPATLWTKATTQPAPP